MGDTEAGWQHFADADWAAARDAFAVALEEDPGDPAALDGLGQSLWWLGEREAAIDRRREAYAAYQRRGDARRAGGLATYLAGEHRIDGQDAAASGWLSRAQRLLAGVGVVPEQGWLAIEEANGRPIPRRPSVMPGPRSTSPMRWAIPTSSAWRWPRSAGAWCARAASRRASRCSTRR